MNFQKENHEIVQQNDKNVKKSQKHDANLQKNTTLYFQIGLILTLFVVYGLFEMKFESQPTPEVYKDIGLVDEYVYNDVIKIFEEQPKEIIPKKQKPLMFNDPVIAENDDPKIEAKDLFPETETKKSPTMNPAEVPPVIEVEEDFNILAVEQVPVYPGCENLNTNSEKRVCMEQKLAKLINRKFDKDIASDFGLSGVQKIYVQFKINKSGNVTDIKARAPHKALEKEAKKVIAIIPQMKPGKQAQKPVNIIYSLPILFQVQD